MMRFLLWIFSVILGCSVSESADCNPTVTSITKIVNEEVCSGKIIFEDEFEYLNMKTWQHENTLSGGGNLEFQWYTNNRTNSYTKNGILYIKPSLTADHLGENSLSYRTLSLESNSPVDSCTDPTYNGCQKTATPQNILNPIKSARLSTVKSFSFKFGKIEISAKMPSGDWLIPEIVLLPAHNVYGSWPASGEITLAQSRGNKQMLQGNDNVGVKRVSSMLHFGPFIGSDAWEKAYFIHESTLGFNEEFHLYTFEWTPDQMKFSVDGKNIRTVKMVKGGFWAMGDFEKSYPEVQNPWKHSKSTRIAPFDQEYYIAISLAVGGTTHFSDKARYSNAKPWKNDSPAPMKEFYEDRTKWLSTWKLDENDGESAAFQIDYVKVYAI